MWQVVNVIEIFFNGHTILESIIDMLHGHVPDYLTWPTLPAMSGSVITTNAAVARGQVYNCNSTSILKCASVVRS